MDMRRSLAILVLLGLVGLVAGVIATELGPSHTPYTATEEFYSHSGDAFRLAAVARNQHVHGARVRVLDAHTFQIIGHGSRTGAISAELAIVSQVREAIKDMSLTHVSWIHSVDAGEPRPDGNVRQTGLIGLLAGLGAGVAIVVTLRRRMTAMPA